MKTLTVRELITVLSKLEEQDLPIVATWEGVEAAITEDNIELIKGLEDYPHRYTLDVEDYRKIEFS